MRCNSAEQRQLDREVGSCLLRKLFHIPPPQTPTCHAMQLKIKTVEGEAFCVEVEPSTKMGRVRELIAQTEHAKARKWRAKDIRLVLYGKTCIKDSSDVDKKLETVIVQPSLFDALETFLVAVCPEKKRAAPVTAANQAAALLALQAAANNQAAANAQAAGAGGHYFTAATVAGALQAAMLPEGPPADGGGEDEEDDGEEDDDDDDDDDDDEGDEDDESMDDADEDEEDDDDASVAPAAVPFTFSADIVMEAASAAGASRPPAPAAESLGISSAQAEGAEDRDQPMEGAE